MKTRKATYNRTATVLITTLSLALLFGAVIFGYTQLNKAPVTEQKAYAFSELGTRCDEAAITYRNKAETYSAQIEKDYADTQAEIAKTQAMNNAVANNGNIYNNPSIQVQSEINRISTEASKYYEDGKEKVEEMKASAARLESCANSAKAERDFTTTEVADFEVLISGSGD